MRSGIRMGRVWLVAGVLLGLFACSLALPAAGQAGGGVAHSPPPAPAHLRVTAFYSDGFDLAWDAITVTAPGGRYHWRVAERSDGAAVANGATADLQATAAAVRGLQPGRVYVIQVRSVLPGGLPGSTNISAPAILVAATRGAQPVLLAVYFAADNDLAPYIPLIRERLRVGTALNPNARVVYLADGAEDGDTQLWVAAGGVLTLTQAVAGAWGATELNTADPDVLAWFLRHARQHYGGGVEIVALLGHGVALAPDLAYLPPTAPGEPPAQVQPGIPALPQGLDNTPGDVTSGAYLSTVGLGRALAAATDDGAAPFDLLFFDQCFQGNLDVLYEVQTAAQVFVASPNYAWLVAPYALYLPHFAPALTPSEMADAVIHIYQSLLNNSNPNAIFYVDKADIAAVAAAVDQLGDALGRAVDAGSGALIGLAAERSKYVDTTQCGRGYLHLGPPDELMGASTFARHLQALFPPADPAGVHAAAGTVLTALDAIPSTFRVGRPYLEPTEIWAYNDTLTILAPLPRNAPAAVAWRASIYRADAPFSARWTPAPTQTVIVSQSFAYVADGRWDDFLAHWFTVPMTPTVGEWCNYAPPGVVISDTTRTLALASTPVSGGIRLTWTPPPDLTPAFYQVLVRKPEGIHQILAAVLEADARSYRLDTRRNGVYAVTVVAVDEYGAALAAAAPVSLATERLYLPVIQQTGGAY